jgi:hypothetical protein
MGTNRSKISLNPNEQAQQHQHQQDKHFSSSSTCSFTTQSFSSSFTSYDSRNENTVTKYTTRLNKFQSNPNNQSNKNYCDTYYFTGKQIAYNSSLNQIKGIKSVSKKQFANIPNKENMSSARLNANKRYSLNLDNFSLIKERENQNEVVDKSDAQIAASNNSSSSSAQLSKLKESENKSSDSIINEIEATNTSFQPYWQKNPYFRSFRTASRRFFRPKRRLPIENDNSNKSLNSTGKSKLNELETLNENKTLISQPPPATIIYNPVEEISSENKIDYDKNLEGRFYFDQLYLFIYFDGKHD